MILGQAGKQVKRQKSIKEEDGSKSKSAKIACILIMDDKSTTYFCELDKKTS